MLYPKHILNDHVNIKLVKGRLVFAADDIEHS